MIKLLTNIGLGEKNNGQFYQKMTKKEYNRVKYGQKLEFYGLSASSIKLNYKENITIIVIMVYNVRSNADLWIVDS